jgi:hypothetical protein
MIRRLCDVEQALLNPDICVRGGDQAAAMPGVRASRRLTAAFALPCHQRRPAREFSPPWALKLEPATTCFGF